MYLYLFSVRRNGPGRGRSRARWYRQRGRLPPHLRGRGGGNLNQGWDGKRGGRGKRGNYIFIKNYINI